MGVINLQQYNRRMPAGTSVFPPGYIISADDHGALVLRGGGFAYFSIDKL